MSQMLYKTLNLILFNCGSHVDYPDYPNGPPEVFNLKL